MKLGFVVLTLAVLWPACKGGASAANDSAAVEAPPTDEDAIEAVEAALLDGFKTRDASKVGAQFSDTAVLAMPNTSAAQGQKAIARLVRDRFSDPAFSFNFTNSGTEVAVSSDLGFTHGTYRGTSSDPKTGKTVNQAGNYTAVFRKQPGGTWKAVNEIVSSPN